MVWPEGLAILMEKAQVPASGRRAESLPGESSHPHGTHGTSAHGVHTVNCSVHSLPRASARPTSVGPLRGKAQEPSELGERAKNLGLMGTLGD